MPDPTPDRQTHEEWRPVPGWPAYEVSNLGRVRSLKGAAPRALTPWAVKKGGRVRSMRVNLCGPDGQPQAFRVHALVMLAFVGPRPAGLVICHSSGDPTENRLANLRYDTVAANAEDARRHGALCQGERHGAAVLTEAAVRHIRASDETGVALAQRYGVHPRAVQRARNATTWRSVGEQEASP